MRTILVLICLVIIGAVGLSYLKNRHPADAPVTAPADRETPAPRSTAPAPADNPRLIDRAHDVAVSAKDAVADKLGEWHLSGSDIRRELEKGGEVVRTKARAAGSSIATASSNAKIISFIKAKYALDKDLSARDIEVSCDTGKVVLNGTAASEELIGRAIALALDTDGVVEVKSRLIVAQPATS